MSVKDPYKAKRRASSESDPKNVPEIRDAPKDIPKTSKLRVNETGEKDSE
jgi:hypothetical protein